MATTYQLITKSILTGNQTTIDFQSIPADYTDLYFVFSLRSDVGGTNQGSPRVTFNNNTSSYNNLYLQGTGTGVGSGTFLTTAIYAGACTSASNTSNTFSLQSLYIPNYLGSQNKSVSVDSVTENNASSANAELVASIWSNSSAINRITITEANGSNFVANSSAYLYGIKNS